MNILAVDTASEWASVAIRSSEQFAAEINLHSTDGFAHLIFPAIAEALRAANLSLADIDCFAAGNGPGSFTGVRVALSVVKGLAEANGKQAAGISNLRALATYSGAIRRAVLIDARRRDVYAAVFDPALEPVSPEVVTKLSTWLEELEPNEYEFIVQTGAPFREELAASRWSDMSITEAPRSLAVAIALCAETDRRTGGWSDPALLDANYVRRSDAELSWQEV